MALVRYRPVPAHTLPYGPVAAIVCEPTLTVSWRVAEGQMDPLLGLAWAASGTTILRGLPAITANMVRVHRDRSLGGDELLVPDVGPDWIDVRVAYDLIKRPAAQELARHSTRILCELKSAFGDLPALGQDIHIPR